MDKHRPGPRDDYSYLPQRISGGSFSEEGLVAVTRECREVLPWDKIRMVFLGIIEESPLESSAGASPPEKDTFQKLLAWTPLLMGLPVLPGKGKKNKPGKRPPAAPKIYVEIFAAGREKPFRMDANSLNYRGFLPQVEYSSETNFKKLLDKLSEKLPACKFDPSFQAYRMNQKTAVRRYGSVYEFQRDCLRQWEDERKQNP